MSSKNNNNYDDWIVGIQDPQSNLVIKKIKLNNLSMATSGTYNNYFELNGVTYSHILNPKTGYPYKHKTISATVIAKDCIDADAYATLSLTIDPNKVLSLINKIENVDCYIVEVDSLGNILEYKSNDLDTYLIF